MCIYAVDTIDFRLLKCEIYQYYMRRYKRIFDL